MGNFKTCFSSYIKNTLEVSHSAPDPQLLNGYWIPNGLKSSIDLLQVVSSWHLEHNQVVSMANSYLTTLRMIYQIKTYLCIQIPPWQRPSWTFSINWVSTIVIKKKHKPGCHILWEVRKKGVLTQHSKSGQGKFLNDRCRIHTMSNSVCRLFCQSSHRPKLQSK